MLEQNLYPTIDTSDEAVLKAIEKIVEDAKVSTKKADY